MGKLRFDFILGYRILRVESEEQSEFLSKIVRNGVSVLTIDGLRFKISERDFKKINSLGLISERCSVSGPFGILGFFLKTFRRYGVLAALFLSVILVFFASNTVFDIRINGSEEMDKDELLEALDTCGLRKGTFWFNLDRSETEAKLLDTCEKISWVNVNRRGNVAYVDIIEKKTGEELGEFDFCNVIAAYDCVIEDITVKRGYPVVKKGDTVKQGDVVISGVPPAGIGGFCMAEGVVIGRINQKIEASHSYEIEEKIVVSQKKSGLAIKIFNFLINIFDFCGNSVPKYDIIERKTDLTLFGKELPISIVNRYDVGYVFEKKMLSESELVNLVSDEMALLVSESSRNAELLKMKSFGQFDDGGYKLTTDIVLLKEVGESVPFEIQ